MKHITTWERWTPPPGSTDPWANPSGRGTSAASDLAPAIAAWLRRHPGSGYAEIAQGVGRPASTVSGHMREAAQRGELRLERETEQTGQPVRPFRFRLAR